MTVKYSHICERDEWGWRVPRPGTLSRQVYELVSAGKGNSHIATVLGESPQSVGVLRWKMRHPEASNARQNKLNARQGRG